VVSTALTLYLGLMHAILPNIPCYPTYALPPSTPPKTILESADDCHVTPSPIRWKFDARNPGIPEHAVSQSTSLESNHNKGIETRQSIGFGACTPNRLHR
jgi:hypothetical protein